MNSPYTKHLDSTRDTQGSHTATATRTSVAPTHTPSYAAPTVPAGAPMTQQPVVIERSSGTSSGSKAGMALIAIIMAIVAGLAGWAVASKNAPTWSEVQRYEALAAREGEIRGRDGGWAEGRSQGRTEMEYLAKYERLRNQAESFNAGWQNGLNTGQQMGKAQATSAYYNRYGYGNRWGGRGYGYGSSYGYYGSSRVSNAIASAQSIANATGQPVDVTF